MEVLYHVRPYFVGMFPYIGLKQRPHIYGIGTSDQSDPEDLPAVIYACFMGFLVSVEPAVINGLTCADQFFSAGFPSHVGVPEGTHKTKCMAGDAPIKNHPQPGDTPFL